MRSAERTLAISQEIAQNSRPDRNPSPGGDPPIPTDETFRSYWPMETTVSPTRRNCTSANLRCLTIGLIGRPRVTTEKISILLLWGDYFICRTVLTRPFKMPGLTIDLMNTQSTIHTTPQIVIADRNKSTKAFPTPVARTPFFQAVLDSTTHVSALGNQRYPRRLIERFQATNNRQELQTLPTTGFRLGIRGRETLLRSEFLQHKTPSLC